MFKKFDLKTTLEITYFRDSGCTNLVFTDTNYSIYKGPEGPFWDAELSKERKETSDGIQHAVSTQVNGSLTPAGKDGSVPGSSKKIPHWN